jgi:hypothetical protein
MTYHVEVVSRGDNGALLCKHLNDKAKEGWTLDKIVVKTQDEVLVVMAKEDKPD